MKVSKKFFAVLLASLMTLGLIIIGAVPSLNVKAEIIDSGTCGDDLSWTLDDQGTLTISGTGSMNDYSYVNLAPWYSKRNKVSSVVIENGVTSIGNYGFKSCSWLTSVEIPSSVTSVGEDAFYDCTGLERVEITDIDAWCRISFIGYSSTPTSNPLYYAHNLYLNGNLVTDIVIPSDVTSISKNAFAGWTGLRSVVIPDSVESIGARAFKSCTGLTSIEIPDSVTSIGDEAFRYCTGLTRVDITDLDAWCRINFSTYSNPLNYARNLYINGNNATEVVIPNSVTSIGRYAFEGWCGTSVEIPASITSIGRNAFYNCTELTRVEITDIEAWCRISFSNQSSNPLYYAHNLYLNDILVTDVEIPNGVESLGDYAFTGWSGTSVKIPASITSIGKNAFFFCTELTRVEITDIEAWCRISFSNDFSNPLFYAHNLYLNDILVTDVEIPNGIESLGDYAFTGWSGTSVKIPDSVTSIGYSAFAYCRSLTNIEIPNSVTSISGYAFSNCIELLSIDLPDSLTSISGGLFYNCTGLTSVEIPSSVTIIDTDAFYNCTGLRSIEIPNSLTLIVDFAFGGCGALTDIYYHGTQEQWDAIRIISSDIDSVREAAVHLRNATVHFLGIDECLHHYKITVTPPTCTEQGYTTCFCSKCGDSYTQDYVDAVGHKDDDHDGFCDFGCGTEVAPPAEEQSTGEGSAQTQPTGFIARLTQFFRSIINFFKKLFK